MFRAVFSRIYSIDSMDSNFTSDSGSKIGDSLESILRSDHDRFLRGNEHCPLSIVNCLYQPDCGPSVVLSLAPTIYRISNKKDPSKLQTTNYKLVYARVAIVMMEDQKAYVNVKNRVKEYNHNHDDDTFRSVKDRLRVFDARQDVNVRETNSNCNSNRSAHHNVRESIGKPCSEADRSRSNRSSSSLKENSTAATTTEVYAYGNVMLKKVEKPVVNKWKHNKTVPTVQEDKLSELRDNVPVANKNKWKAMNMKKEEENRFSAIPPAFATAKRRSAAMATTNSTTTTNSSTRVSDLAKTFSPQVKLASNGERAEEQKVIGRVATNAFGTHEIVHIRSNLKSTAKELEELRKNLNKTTSVAKLIAERNKAAEANKSTSQNIYGLPRDGRMMYGIPRSKSMGRFPNSHRRTKSMSSSKDGLNWDSAQARRDSIDTLGGFSNLCWEDFKANNPNAPGTTIWDLNLDDTSLFGRPQSCTALDVLSGGGHDDRLLTSNSTLTEPDSDGEYYHDDYGHSTYIQITLSSGGIVEKCEPVICMTLSDDSSGEYQSEFGMDLSVDLVDSKHSTRKALMGAKKFFFGGKTKRKNGPIEV